MANWTTLKASIANIIKTNGNQEITGQLLQNVLNSIINFVGENATFVGIATPATNPGVPDGPVFYFANAAGTYSNFDGIKLDNPGLIILYNLSDKWQSLKVYECLQTRGSSQLYPMSQQAITSIVKLLEDNINLLTYDFESVKDSILNIESDLNTKIEAEDFDYTVESLEANLLTDAIRKTPQVLTAAEQSVARDNIGAQKQITTSADLALSSDDVLSLTDMAKKRLFIDLWNQAAGDYGRYNDDTGYFELYEIYDIGWDEALLIYRISGQWDYSTVNFNWSNGGLKSPIVPRAFLPLTRAYNGETAITVGTNFHNETIQYLSLINKATGNESELRCLGLSVTTHGFRFPKLIKFYGIIQINIVDNNNTHVFNMPNLVYGNFKFNRNDYKVIYFRANLNYECTNYLFTQIPTQNANGQCVFKLAANMYNRLSGTATDYETSGGTKEEWMAIADLAASKNITLATE
jgi:hypothetical protein